MKSGPKNTVDQLRRRIERVLQRSFDWVAWQRALEATFVDEYLRQPGSHLTYCLDTSLIIEYLLPRPLQNLPSTETTGNASSGFPRPLDLALFLLFDPTKSINILPPHHKEFLHKVQEWQRRLTIQRMKLRLFQAALDRLLAMFDSGDGGSPKGDWLQQFIDAVLSEESGFGSILALETQGPRSVTAIVNRLQVVAQGSLANMLDDWNSAKTKIDVLYKALSRTAKGGDTPFNNRIDAHALYLLEKENEQLRRDHYLILLTESSKIWSFLSSEEQRRAVDFKNRRGKVWLIQTPEVELVSALVEAHRGESESRDEAQRELILDLEQNRRLREIRDEVEHDILPRLEELANDATKWQASETLVQELEDGLDELKTLYQDRDRLRTLQLGMDARENWGGALFQKIRSLRGTDRRDLHLALSSELNKLDKLVCDLERQMLIFSPLPPDEDASLDLLGALSPELQGVVRSQAEGTAYFIRFQSNRILGHLQQLEDILGHFDEGGGSGESEILDDRLQKAMQQARVESREEPEYNLLLAAIYASRGLWFDAYVASEQCLKRLAEGPPPSASEIISEQVEFETELIKGAVLQNWALARYGDLPKLAEQFLKEAAQCVRVALERSTINTASGPLGSKSDPRALRELATIYGNAREVEELSRKEGRLEDGERLLTPEEKDVELAGLPVGQAHGLLTLYRALAERAYEGVAQVPSMRVYFVNTLLFALVEEDGEDLALRDELARELEVLNQQEDHVNFLDTLGWFHFRKAQRIEKQGGDFTVDFQKAREYIRRAKGKLRHSKSRHRFFTYLLRSREQEMEAFEFSVLSRSSS